MGRDYDTGYKRHLEYNDVSRDSDMPIKDGRRNFGCRERFSTDASIRMANRRNMDEQCNASK